MSSMLQSAQPARVPLPKRKRLGEVLCERKQLTHEDLERALSEQAGAGRLGEFLLRRGMVARGELAAALQEVTRFPFVNALECTPTPDAIALVPKAMALKFCALPLQKTGPKRLEVLMGEPQNLTAADELRFMTGMNIEPVIGFSDDILAAIERWYPKPAQVRHDPDSPVPPFDADATPTVEFVGKSRSARFNDEGELHSDHTPAVRVVSALIAAGIERGASDIHIEQAPTETEVRIRVDGVLHDLTTVPLALRSALVSRIKILADLDIAEQRQPQDGRFLARYHDRPYDVRVSTLPTQFGEKVVLRLLDPNGTGVQLDALGLGAEDATAVQRLLQLPEGMLLVTGPTGSGKSTSLYSMLNVLGRGRINITTVEDPVEYMIKGANQVQVDVKAGRSFASCLRSILRQDPNVIMVGEVRDGETAEIALRASQTGHLVLSTLHTNDAVSAISRLMDLNAAPFLIASSLSGVLAQRLVRKLCACRKRVPASREHLRFFPHLRHAHPEMWEPVGCVHCWNTGYKGRVGIFELLLFDEAIRDAVGNGVRDDDVRNLAISRGMVTMQDDGLAKVDAGLTTLEEVMRVVPLDIHDGVRCQACEMPLSAMFAFCPHCGERTATPHRAARTPRRMHHHTNEPHERKTLLT